MNSFAIVETGGKQLRVEPQQLIAVERVRLGAGEKEVHLDKVLAAGDEKSFTVGNPYLKDASVVCEYLGERKEDKKIIFKIRRRKNYRRKKGHRQILTELRVKEIQLKG